MAGRWQTGHAPLTQNAKGLQRHGGRFGDAGEQATGCRLILDQLLQGLVGCQVLRTHRTTGQGNQVEGLRQQVHQHRIGRQASAAGAGEHAPPFDTGHHHFYFGAAQYVDQGHGLQVVGALGKGNQGSKGHQVLSTE
ncbi:hypothetical protein D3C81_1155180 [compost metagenome]